MKQRMEQKVQTKCQDSQKKEQKDGIIKGRERRKCNIGDRMLLNNSRCDTSQLRKASRRRKGSPHNINLLSHGAIKLQ